MDQLEDHEFKMEVYLDEPEKINDYNSENQANSSPRRRTTRKRATPKESSDSSDSENDEVKDSNALKRVQLLEKQLRACCKELNDMRDENLALRENNVKYQVLILNLSFILNKLNKMCILGGNLQAAPTEP